MALTILIGGDIVPTATNEKEFREGNMHLLIDTQLWDILTSADYRIFNLETPITDRKDPIAKEGPKFIGKSSTMEGLKAIQTDLVTLANNHILDQGELGIKDTINNLNQYGIAYVGGGDSLHDASKPYIIEKEGVRIGVYACAEREYTIATERKAGANPFEPLESLDHIMELSKNCDYTLVLYHSGKEYYRYPTPYLQRVCRRMVEKGASAVICQHSHCIGCQENYKGGTIVYGQGNFLFDLDDRTHREFYQTSLLVQLSFQETAKLSYIPILKNGKGIRLAGGDDRDRILNAFYKRSEEIMESKFVENTYHEFALKKGSRYLIRYSKIGTILSAIDMRFFHGKIFDRSFGWLYTKRQKRTIENSMQCETHRELLLTYLKLEKERIRKKKKG